MTFQQFQPFSLIRWSWSAMASSGNFKGFSTSDRLLCPVFSCSVPDGFTGVLWGPLQPHHSLWPPHLLQLGAKAALQELLLLLPPTHVQTEGGEAAVHRWETYHGHLQIHPHLQLWRVQLNSGQRHLEPSAQHCQLFWEFVSVVSPWK